MLDDFKETQSVAYNVMVNEINNNMVSHAYLIDENGNKESFNIVIAFVKAILCKKGNTKLDLCGDCSLCKRIDDGNYPEIKVIEADGMYIKKQQVIDLQKEFSMSSIEGDKRIYIVRDCDKMRAETANSMLKFLEEPDSNIIAILMTNNYNNILPTIISRCQVIKLNGQVLIDDDDEISKIAIDLINSMEHNGIKAILNLKELWSNNVGVKDRDKMSLIVDRIIDMYYDILKVKEGFCDIRFSRYYNDFVEICSINKIADLLYKIDYLIKAKDSIKLNVNSNLFIDGIVINIGGYNDSRN